MKKKRLLAGLLVVAVAAVFAITLSTHFTQNHQYSIEDERGSVPNVIKYSHF